MRDFKKTRETKEQRKKARRLSSNLLLRSCFNLATFSHNTNPSHLCLLRKLDVRIIYTCHVSSRNLYLWDLRRRRLKGGSDAEGAAWLLVIDMTTFVLEEGYAPVSRQDTLPPPPAAAPSAFCSSTDPPVN